MLFVYRYQLQLMISVILAALFVIFIVLSPGTFLSSRIYTAYMSTIPASAIMALGMTLLIVCGEMDMSFPSVMALCGLVFAGVYLKTDNAVLAAVLCMATGMAAGLVNGILVVLVGIPSIIATIGTQFLWRGLTMLLCGGLAKNMVAIREEPLHALVVGRIGEWLPAQSLWCIFIAVLLWLFLNRHPLGDAIRFTGDSMDTARMLGIPVQRVRIGVFILMGFLTALTSIIVCLEMATWWPTQGEGYMLIVFASVFIGGTSVFGGKGTIYGTLAGAVIIGMIEAGFISAGISGLWTRFVYGLVIIVSVSFYALTTRKSAR